MKKVVWKKIVTGFFVWCFVLATSLYIFLPLGGIEPNTQTPDDQGPSFTPAEQVNNSLRVVHQVYPLVTQLYAEVNNFVRDLEVSRNSVYQHRIKIEDLQLGVISTLSLPGDNAALAREYYAKILELDLLGRNLVNAQLQKTQLDDQLKMAKALSNKTKEFLLVHQAFSRALINRGAALSRNEPNSEVALAFNFLAALDNLITRFQQADRVSKLDLNQVKAIRAQMQEAYDKIFKKNQQVNLQYSGLYISIQKAQLLTNQLTNSLNSNRLGNKQYLLRAEELLEVYNFAVEEYNASL